MRIDLVKFNKKFITKKYISWLNNKQLMKYSEQRLKKHNYKSCKLYLQNAKKNKDLFFAVIEKIQRKHVGNIYIKIDKTNKVADIRILIGEVNNGYGLDAWKSAIILLKKNKIRKITAGTVSSNLAMLRIFKKTNMKFEYRKIKQTYVQRKLNDIIGYYLLFKR